MTIGSLTDGGMMRRQLIQARVQQTFECLNKAETERGTPPEKSGVLSTMIATSDQYEFDALVEEIESSWGLWELCHANGRDSRAEFFNSRRDQRIVVVRLSDSEE